MKNAAALLANHQTLLRTRALSHWNRVISLKALREALLVAVTLGSITVAIICSVGVKELADKIIVSDRVREVDRLGQTVGSHGATYALPADKSRHKLLHDFVACVFNVEPNYDQMLDQTDDCLAMTDATKPGHDAVLKYWAEHSPLRADGTWMTQLATPLSIHVTSYLNPHTLKSGDEEWTVQFTLNGINRTTANDQTLYEADITLTPNAPTSDADPYGLVITEFSWDALR